MPLLLETLPDSETLFVWTYQMNLVHFFEIRRRHDDNRIETLHDSGRGWKRPETAEREGATWLKTYAAASETERRDMLGWRTE